MKKIVKIIIGVAIGLVLVIAIAFSFTLIWLNNVKKADYYSIDGETIPSIKTVVEERKVTSASTKIVDGTRTKTYNFVSESAIEDTYAYTKYLVEKEGFMHLKDTGQNGVYTYAKESGDNGKILLVSITFSSSSFTIQIQKGEGTITY